MKKIIIVNIILALCFSQINEVKSQGCSSFTTLNVSTGIDASGANLATPGAIDPFWQLTNIAPPSVNGGGGINIPNGYTILSGASVGLSNWCEIPGTVSLNVIPDHNFFENNLIPAQPWKFRRRFSVRAAGTITISGSYIGDDQSELHICDPTGAILFTDNQAGWNSIKEFSSTLQVSPGCYFIELELTNVGNGYMGFAVNATVASSSNILGNPSQSCCNGSIISGQKWIDQNCDGIINDGDTPGSGWTINLLSGSSVIQTTITDINGQYYFNNVPLGNYTVTEVNQPGFIPKNPVSGSQTVNITQGNSVMIINFLNCLPPPCNCNQNLTPVLTWQTANGSENRNLACNQIYTNQLECYKAYTINVNNPCGNGANCAPDEVITTITYPNGTVSTSSSLTGVPLIVNALTGDYVISIRVRCNGVWCQECKMTFKQTKSCQPACSNCKINGQDKVQATFNASGSNASTQNFPAATSLNASFLLGGGADTYTQLRVNVVDIQLSSDNPACLQCYNKTNQWGSIIAGNLSIGGFTTSSTTYNSIATSNPYNSSREIIFDAATPVAIPSATTLNLNMQIPGANPISCCCINMKIFIKITYRNNKCEECSKIVRVDLTQCSTGGTGTVTFNNNATGPLQYRIASPNRDANKPVNFSSENVNKN